MLVGGRSAGVSATPYEKLTFKHHHVTLALLFYFGSSLPCLRWELCLQPGFWNEMGMEHTSILLLWMSSLCWFKLLRFLWWFIMQHNLLKTDKIDKIYPVTSLWHILTLCPFSHFKTCRHFLQEHTYVGDCAKERNCEFRSKFQLSQFHGARCYLRFLIWRGWGWSLASPVSQVFYL